jgi:hypothetical protein
MTTIQINIDVLNHHEIIKDKKGAIIGFFADLFMSDEKLQRKVEAKVTEEILKQLKESLAAGLRENNIIANISFSTKTNHQG